MENFTTKKRLSNDNFFQEDDDVLNLSGNTITKGDGVTIVTAISGTTTLTNNSTNIQILTGTTGHTHYLPVVSTLSLGHPFKFKNESTGLWIIKSSGGNVVTTIATGLTIEIVCIGLNGTDETNWSVLISSTDSEIYIPITQPIISDNVMTLNCADRFECMFEGRTSVETLLITNDFTIEFSNETNTKLISLILNVSGTNAITFPSGVMCSNPSTNGIWNTGSRILTLASGSDKIVELQLIKYETSSKWLLKVGEEAE
jgi:hypothetical protein